MHLAALYLHPVKSLAPLAVEAAIAAPRGLRNDRRWMVVDEAGRFLTGRALPVMVTLRARPDAADAGLWLSADGAPDLHVPPPAHDAPRLAVEVWKDRAHAALAGDEADAWLSARLGRPVRLVHMDAAATRAIDASYAAPGETTSFGDGFPYLLLTASAMDALNARLPRALPITRFRPNLVIGGAAPHAEDRWRRVRIGQVEFVLPKPCTRCVFTTIDPASGERDPDGQPLEALKAYRRTEAGITFGMNAIARGIGALRVGDAVEVLETA